MKIYISADIEGCAGISHWDEAEKGHPAYDEFRRQMTRETVAACEGAGAAGATEIWVKDAHDSGRNLLIDAFPDEVRLIRGWSGDPMSMVQELDRSFDAVVMIGYHATAGSEANPLAHSLSSKAPRILLNGQSLSEFRCFGLAAALHEVPVAFLSGDAGICAEVQRINERIPTLAVKTGYGDSVNSLAANLAVDRIRSGVKSALEGALSERRLALAEAYELEVYYSDPVTATRMSFFPGVERAGERTLRFSSRDYYEVLRTIQFIAG
ncbi:MAG: M55 family metallopeptidase [Hyphomicrobiaceae bacterium]